MRTSIFCIAMILMVAIAGCDKPLAIEQGDNEPAIQLSLSTENGLPKLSWNSISHPGFEGYWLVKVPPEGVIIGDSLQLSDFQVLFTSKEAQANSFIDNVPILSEEGNYQLLASINGRFVQSNVLPAENHTISIEGLLLFGKILGKNGQIYFLYRDLGRTGKHYLARYDMAKQQIEAQLELPFVRNISNLEVGDFGAGKEELAFYNSDGSLYFYDAHDFSLNHSEIFGSTRVESMKDLGNGYLAIVQHAGTNIVSFTRNGNQWVGDIRLPGGFASTSSLLEHVPGKEELVLVTQPDRFHRIGFDRFGKFNSIFYKRSETSSSFTSLAIDPQGVYCMPSRFGDVYRIDDFEIETQLPGDSSGLGNRVWGFNASGEQLIIGNNIFPTGLFIYNRQGFNLEYQGSLTSNLLFEKVIEVDGQHYMVLRNNDATFSIILSPIPN